jgi:hypothetical protein
VILLILPKIIQIDFLYFFRIKKKKCVAYPQEDFLFIKLKTCFGISLLKIVKDFQFHLKTTKKIFFKLNIRFLLHDLFELL